MPDTTPHSSTLMFRLSSRMSDMALSPEALAKRATVPVASIKRALAAERQAGGADFLTVGELGRMADVLSIAAGDLLAFDPQTRYVREQAARQKARAGA